MIFDGKPSVVGHRGFGAGTRDGYRENSPQSFQAAANAGLAWVELDVQRSADGVLVVRHDPVMASGESVVSRSAAELSAEGICALDDVLDGLPPEVGVDIDVKTIIDDATDPPRLRTAALVADALLRHRDSRPLLVTSFDPAVVTYLAARRDTLGEAALGLLTDVFFPLQHGIPAAANLGLDAWCPHARSISAEPGAIDVAHQAGLEVLTWVPDPAAAAVLARAGVDAVCVDDVPGTLAALRQLRERLRAGSGRGRADRASGRAAAGHQVEPRVPARPGRAQGGRPRRFSPASPPGGPRATWRASRPC